MMEPVSDHEQQQAGPPAVRPPSEPAPAPPSIDPEAVRQFQQFQQFQELIRHQPPGAPVPYFPPPPPPKPLWQKFLGSKLVRRLILLAIIVVLASYAYDRFFGSKDDDLPASVTGGGKTDTNLVLDTNPYETVRKVYHHIAQNVPEQACGRFTEEGARAFAAANGADDCAHAVAGLHAKVTNRNGYAEPDFHGKMGGVPVEDTIAISSCDLTVTSGPRLGAFTVHRIAKDQWIITDYRNVTCP
jgi:hypothetical protein